MEQETYLTVAQFAQLVNCDKYTIYHWIYDGKLPHITINGTRTIRIPLSQAITNHPTIKQKHTTKPEPEPQETR